MFTPIPDRSPVKRREFADFFGVSETTLNRTIRELHKQGLIKVEKK